MCRNFDELFEAWMRKRGSRTFVKDGIVEPAKYGIVKGHKSCKLLFVLPEPNGRKGGLPTLDLCELLREELSSKPFNLNLGLWTKMILDGKPLKYEPLSPECAREYIQHVAIINLKKLYGSGNANPTEIAHYAWEDRKYICDEIDLIKPDVIIACGESARTNRNLYRVLKDCRFIPNGQLDGDKHWEHNEYIIVPNDHPSLRYPIQTKSAFGKLIRRVRKANICAFSK